MPRHPDRPGFFKAANTILLTFPGNRNAKNSVELFYLEGTNNSRIWSY